MLKHALSLSLMLLAATGCSSDTPDAGDTKGGAAADASKADVPKDAESTPDQKGDKSREPAAKNGSSKAIAADRSTLEGRWIFAIHREAPQQQVPIFLPVAILELAGADGEPLTARVLAGPEGLEQPPTVKSIERTDDGGLHLVLAIQDTPIDFQGRLLDGQVPGNYVLGEDVNPNPAQLFPTELESLEGVDLADGDLAKAFEAATESSKRTPRLQEFIRRHPHDPLALNAYMAILSSGKRENLDLKTVEAAAEGYIKAAGRFGNRMEQQARANAGYALGITGHAPDLALRLIDEAEKRLTGEMKGLSVGLDRARQAARVTQAMQRLENASPEQQAEAVEALQAMQQENPFLPEITLALAEHAEKQENLDVAIEQYARLAVLPQAEQFVQETWAQEGVEKPLPSESLAALWKEKHGNTKELQAYLTDVYRRTIHSFASDHQEEQKQGSRIALVELFTGSACPPCVAADVAIGGLETVHDTKQLIALRYHQHIPAPDPLVNADGEKRYEYYPARGTPQAFLNGEQIENVGGFLPHILGTYQRIHESVDAALGQDSPIRFNLKADAADGSLEVSAEVEGLEEISEDLRLRLVLVEEEIDFVAQNGIRVHEMVVRSMPGGPGGVEPDSGKLSHTQTISLGELKQGLVEYLSGIESQTGAEFPIKPLEMSKLHLVAFVQNDATREILNAAVIPVSGTLEFPEVKAE